MRGLIQDRSGSIYALAAVIALSLCMSLLGVHLILPQVGEAVKDLLRALGLRLG